MTDPDHQVPEPSEHPGEATAVDGLVIVDGPGAVALTLTVAAAEAMADRLRRAAQQARKQGG